MPFVDGDLTGEDRRAAPITLLEDLVEVTTCAGIERFEAPVSRMRSWMPVRLRRMRA
jgi:hypothetical protein